MLDKASIIIKIKKLISEELDTYIKETEIKNDMPLFEEGLGLDSVNLIELIALVEKHFNIKFADNELSVEYFSTVEVLADTIISKT